jgi:hypothetical protein
MNLGMLHDAIAAVCPIDGISISDVGDKSKWRIDFSAGATAQQKDAAAQVVAGFDPNTPAHVYLSYVTLRSRLTIAERQAILTAARSDWRLADWMGLAQAEGTINLSTAETLAAKAALISAGLLTPARVDEVFAP